MRGSFLWAVLLLMACSAPHVERADTTAETTSTSTAVALPSTPQSDWREFHGDGFTLRTPPASVVDSTKSHPNDQPGIAIEGPTIRDSTGRTGPAWRLVVVTYPNDGGRPLGAWVDSVRTERNKASAGDPDSLAWLSPPDSLALGRQRALRLQPFCGDCEAYEVYVAVPRRLVMFDIVYDIGIPGDRDRQRALYDAILSTFRVDSASVPDRRPNGR